MPFEDKLDDGRVVVVTEEEGEAPSSRSTAPSAVRTDPPQVVPSPSSRRRPSADLLAPAPAGLEVDRDFDASDREANLGRILFVDYKESRSQYPGAIFAIGTTTFEPGAQRGAPKLT